MSRSSTLSTPAPRGEALERARQSLERRRWSAAAVELAAGDRESPLDPMELVQLAQAELLIDNKLEGAQTLARARIARKLETRSGANRLTKSSGGL